MIEHNYPKYLYIWNDLPADDARRIYLRNLFSFMLNPEGPFPPNAAVLRSQMEVALTGLFNGGYAPAGMTLTQFLEFALRAGSGMISEISKQFNNSGLVFEFVASQAGCSLDLQLSYEGKPLGEGVKETNPFIAYLKGRDSFIAVGGPDAAGTNGNTSSFNVCADKGSSACFDFTLRFGY